MAALCDQHLGEAKAGETLEPVQGAETCRCGRPAFYRLRSALSVVDSPGGVARRLAADRIIPRDRSLRS